MTSIAKTATDVSSIFSTLTSRTAALPYKLHTTNNLLSSICQTPALQAEAVAHALATRPLIHRRMLPLIARFLQLKQTHGSTIEQHLYSAYTPAQLLDRLLKKRPLMFMNSYDQFLLPGGHDGAGSENFDRIGTSSETQNHAQLTLEHVMSYDEMQLSALLAVSTPTHFINDGGRNNMGRVGPKNGYVKKGVIVGQVGTRFERKQRMAWCHCVVDETQNTSGRGYGVLQSSSSSTVSKSLRHDQALLAAWAEFYDIPYFPTFEEAQQNQPTTGEEKGESSSETAHRYIKLSTLGPTAYLDTLVFQKRAEYIAEIYLIDANARGHEANTKVVCHIVGLGLGVWLIHPSERQLYVDAFGQVLKRVHLPYIQDIFFAYICNVKDCAGVQQGDSIVGPEGARVNVMFGQRNPAALDHLTMTPTSTGELPLLHTQYAWDSNAYPGNEYWVGRLSASGDPAAACCSTIPELQNPDVNAERVCGDNVYIVDASSGGEESLLDLPWIQKMESTN